MAKQQNTVAQKTIADGAIYYDAKLRRSFRLKGYGALKGQIVFRPDIDLTKPIAEQAMTQSSRLKKAPAKAVAART
jgi:hypothetical protein